MNTPSFEEQAEYVRGWFDQVIDGYVVNDFKQLLNIRRDLETGTCAVPMALTAFAVMNLLGFLVSSKKKDPRDTMYFVRIFCTDWMAKVEGGDRYASTKFVSDLVEHFRHGLAHQFLPGGSGITRYPECVDLIRETGDGHYVLVTDVLVEDLLKAIGTLREHIKDDNKKKTIRLMYKKLMILSNYNEETLKTLSDRFMEFVAAHSKADEQLAFSGEYLPNKKIPPSGTSNVVTVWKKPRKNDTPYTS